MKQQFYKSICFMFPFLFFWSGEIYSQDHEQNQIDSKTITHQWLNNARESDPRTKSGFNKFFENFGDWFEDFNDVETNSIFAGWEHLNDFQGSSFNGFLVGGSISNFMFDVSFSERHDDLADAGIDTMLYSLIFTPQFCLQYFSVGCGFGFMDALIPTTTTTNNSTIIEFKHNHSFALRPTVHGFIPLGGRSKAIAYPSLIHHKSASSFSLLLSAGYEIVPKNSELNKWNFAIGLSCHIDD